MTATPSKGDGEFGRSYGAAILLLLAKLYEKHIEARISREKSCKTGRLSHPAAATTLEMLPFSLILHTHTWIDPA